MRLDGLGRVLGVVALLCASACATRFETQTWREARTPHFTLASNAKPELTFGIATQLEHFHATALRLLGIERFDPASPTQVYVFGDRRSFESYAHLKGIAGFFTRGRDQNYLVIDASDERAALGIAYHEYVHYLLRNTSGRSYPPWYHEGLAELLSTLELDETRQKLVVGSVPRPRFATLQLGTPLSLPVLLGAKEPYRWSRTAVDMFYAQSWAFTHWTFAGHVLGQADRRQSLRDYLELVTEGTPESKAFEQAFGATMEQLEPEFLKYAQGTRFASVTLALPSFDARGLELRVLPPAEHLYLLARLAEQQRDFTAPDPEQLLRDAIEADPVHARSLAALGALLSTRGDPEADTLIARAAQHAPDDARIQLAAGKALRARASRESDRAVELRHEARQRFTRSLELDASQTEAALAIAIDALESGEGEEAALSALESARDRRPDYTELNLLLAQLYLARGDKASARRELATVARSPHSAEAAGQATRLAELIDRSGVDVAAGSPASPDGNLQASYELLDPSEEARIESIVPLVSVKGRAGLGDVFLHDVVIAIDESGSTLESAEFDVDGDGEITTLTPGGSGHSATMDRALRKTLISPDSVRAAEFSAALELVRHLDRDTTRVGVVCFNERGGVLVGLGTPEAARAAIEAYESAILSGATSFEAALATSLRTLVASKEPGVRRQRSILMLSDGAPTAGGLKRARTETLQAADALAKYGVRVNAFAIGSDAVQESEVYRELARRTSGRYVPVENVAEVRARLLDVKLSSLERVAMRNRTTGEIGRAVRSFPDGSFDGYVPLAPGWNEIEIRMQVRDRPELVAVRRVLYAPPRQPTDADRVAAEALLEELRLRTVETGLIPRRTKSLSVDTPPGGTLDDPQRKGKLEIEVEPEPAAPPSDRTAP